jgi:hypothetical protein
VQYVVASLFISALIAVQNASGYLTDVDGIDRDLDKRSGQALVALWALFNILYAIRWWYVRLACRQLVHPFTLLRADGIRYLSPHSFMKSIPVWKRLFPKDFGVRSSSTRQSTSSGEMNTFFDANNQVRMQPMPSLGV